MLFHIPTYLYGSTCTPPLFQIFYFLVRLGLVVSYVSSGGNLTYNLKRFFWRPWRLVLSRVAFTSPFVDIFDISSKVILGLVFLFISQSLLMVWPGVFSITIDLVIKALVLVTSFLNIFGLLAFLRYSAQFLVDLVVDLVVYDRPECFLRFFVVYVLRSTVFNTLIFVRTQVSEIMPLVTVSSLFFGFSWLEREVFDMFGIFFLNHPDLRKILNNYCFSGFPLRRDFPLTGPLTGCVMGSVRGSVEIVYALKMC